MRCNFNFNQCNIGPSSPTPIFTCCRNLALAPSNISRNEVINPVFPPVIFAVFASTSVQTIAVGGNVITTLVSASDDSILDDGAGNFTMQAGTYRISYSATGIVPAGGTLSLALYENGVIVPGSTGSVGGVPGTIATISGMAIVTTLSTADVINLRNNLAENEVINLSSISIVRIA